MVDERRPRRASRTELQPTTPAAYGQCSNCAGADHLLQRISRYSFTTGVRRAGTPATSWNSVRWSRPSSEYRSKVASSLFARADTNPLNQPRNTSARRGSSDTNSDSSLGKSAASYKLTDLGSTYGGGLRKGTASSGLFAPRHSITSNGSIGQDVAGDSAKSRLDSTLAKYSAAERRSSYQSAR